MVAQERPDYQSHDLPSSKYFLLSGDLVSTNRKYRTYSEKQQMGTNGRPACLWCKQDVIDKKRSTFCSKECSEEFRLRTDSAFVRLKVFQRDNGICAKCGRDCFTAGLKFPRTRRARGSGDLWQADHILPVVEGGGECGLENYRTLCTHCHRQETAALHERLADARKREREKAQPKPFWELHT
jgi:5-methylcytosine-specific restriction endonuclease McrA